MGAIEAPYCAFEVKVATPSGAPAAKTPVAIIRRNKTIFSQTTTDSNGLARICDAPLEYFDLHVGFDMCGSVEVGGLKPTWPETQRVFVTYVRTLCNHFVYSEKVQILLRVQDERGRPVEGARFAGKPSDTLGSSASDVMGRLFHVIKRGEKLDGVITKEGRLSVPISVPGTEDVDLKVVLRPK